MCVEKSVQYKLTYPDGREEIVLNVPRYDFNWQLTYRTSLKIPRGSTMDVQFFYDNSRANKYNPDPNKWVYYGGQSWEEMGTRTWDSSLTVTLTRTTS
jgi:hypothetical protein